MSANDKPIIVHWPRTILTNILLVSLILLLFLLLNPFVPNAPFLYPTLRFSDVSRG